MAFTNTTASLSELPLKPAPPSLTPLPSRSSALFFSLSKPPFRTLTLTPFISSLRTTQQHTKQNYRSSTTTKPSDPSAPWLSKTPSPNNSSKRVTESVTNEPVHDKTENRYFDGDKGQNAVERIVLRLRNLGLGSEEEQEEEEEEEERKEGNT